MMLAIRLIVFIVCLGIYLVSVNYRGRKYPELKMIGFFFAMIAGWALFGGFQ